MATTLPVVPQGDYPIGTVMSFGGAINEEALQNQGWLYCNGNTASRTIYGDLFAVIGTNYGGGDGSSTFALPDFRGYFQRGVSGATANDPDAASRTAAAPGGSTGNNIGSVEAFATGAPLNAMTTNNTGTHTHTVSNIPNDNSSSAIAGSYQCIWNSGSVNTDTQGAHNHSVNGGGDRETTPVNVYTYFIIKYKQV